jgi:hypothetical protein
MTRKARRGQESTMDAERRVADHGGVAIGQVDAEGDVRDFAGVRIGRVLGDGVVEDFAHVHVGAVVGTRAPRHAAAA